MSGAKLKPLTKDQVSILKKTFRVLNTDELAKRFYASLFEKYPEVRPLFPADVTVLSTKLISVVELIVFSFSEKQPNEFHLQEAVILPLATLGKLHTEKGVARMHYPIANEILLNSIKEESGFVFPPEAEDAWKLALDHLTSAMLNTEVSPSAPVSASTLRDSFNYIKSRLFKS